MTCVSQQGPPCPPGGIWQSLEAILIITAVDRTRSATAASGVEARDAARNPPAGVAWGPRG